MLPRQKPDMQVCNRQSLSSWQSVSGCFQRSLMSKGRPIAGQGQHHPLNSGSKSELKAESGPSIDIHSLCFLIQEQCAQLSHIHVTTVEAILEARSSPP